MYKHQSLLLNAEPSHKHNDWSFSSPYILNVVKIGHASDWYQISNGFAPQFDWPLDRRISLQGSLAWQDKRYWQNGSRNGHALTFSPSVRYGLDASVGAYKGTENSGIQTSANDALGLNLGYYKAFNQTWNLYAAPSWSKTDYDGRNIGKRQRRS